MAATVLLRRTTCGHGGLAGKDTYPLYFCPAGVYLRTEENGRPRWYIETMRNPAEAPCQTTRSLSPIDCWKA